MILLRCPAEMPGSSSGVPQRCHSIDALHWERPRVGSRPRKGWQMRLSEST